MKKKNTNNFLMLLSTKNIFLSLRKNLYLQFNRFRLSFRVKKVDGKFRVYVHKKNKRKIKNVKWILSISGLLLSLIIIPLPYSFFIALFLFLVGLLIEKFFFFFTSFYVHYIPDFEINNDLWLGMAYGHFDSPDGKYQIPVVGLLFSDEEYATKFFSLLRIWNHDSLEDKDNNFVISIILENDVDYHTVIYPNLMKQSAKEFFDGVESLRKKSFPEEKHFRRSAFLFTMKRFIITKNSYLPTFMKRYKDGEPYRLEALIGTEEDKDKSREIPGFIKYNLKIKRLKDLDRKDVEYDLFKLFV